MEDRILQIVFFRKGRQRYFYCPWCESTYPYTDEKFWKHLMGVHVRATSSKLSGERIWHLARDVEQYPKKYFCADYINAEGQIVTSIGRIRRTGQIRAEPIFDKYVPRPDVYRIGPLGMPQGKNYRGRNQRRTQKINLGKR